MVHLWCLIFMFTDLLMFFLDYRRDTSLLVGTLSDWGKVYKKAIFREFTDETYTVMKAREPWQGVLGPTIRGEVGDMAIVHFFNNASMLLSMHPHGSRYIKVHEDYPRMVDSFYESLAVSEALRDRQLSICTPFNCCGNSLPCTLDGKAKMVLARCWLSN
ncbi:hephaestin-like protein [Caerostris extrusa]|uniref:Hephaestin-like protein n=1 Tax=Caerostris extrusa TaxID=172846 RepID=A0AAV4TBY1_CAEEX|nr:hephaestin-like protein [Caerostris extrusa]